MTKKLKQPEVWLRGPIEEIPQLLQPAAHALLQTSEELPYWLDEFPDEQLWEKPAGRASVGFHLKHLTGVLDRMLSYAQGRALTQEQFDYLKSEGIQDETSTAEELIANFQQKVVQALAYFKTLDESTIKSARTVGRKELPSTVIGLLFHAAEHSQRHLGQLIATVSFVKAN
ncbi:MAG TPA: DinB family protein [Leeuwenhoekiella sp.]|nr:DinB family protein [Leeuwenhoekiella sp.]